MTGSCQPSIERDLGDCAFLKAAEMGEAGFFDKTEAFVKIASDFRRGVGVGGKGDGDGGLGGEFEELSGGVLLGAGFVEAGGVEFDRDLALGDRFDDGIVESAEVACGSVGEFFDEIGMAEEVKEA